MRLALDQERLIHMLRESITLLCKTALSYDSELNIEGLLGITLDKSDVFLVNINQSFLSDSTSVLKTHPREDATSTTTSRSSPHKQRSLKSKRRSSGSPSNFQENIQSSGPTSTVTSPTDTEIQPTPAKRVYLQGSLDDGNSQDSHVRQVHGIKTAAKLVSNNSTDQLLSSSETFPSEFEDRDIKGNLQIQNKLLSEESQDDSYTSAYSEAGLTSMGVNIKAETESDGEDLSIIDVTTGDSRLEEETSDETAMTESALTPQIKIATPKEIIKRRLRQREVSASIKSEVEYPMSDEEKTESEDEKTPRADGDTEILYQDGKQIGRVLDGIAEKARYQCLSCEAAYCSRASLVGHQRRIHSLPGGHHCTHCSQVFGSRGGLNQHLDGHYKERRYVCDCGKAFQHKTSLTNHSRICVLFNGTL